VRTTISLDEDVALRLKAEVRRSGKPFKAVVNDYLRVAFSRQAETRAEPRFVIKPVNMGGTVSGRNYDDVEALIEEAEGPLHR
jgi:hypothetical protein